MYALRSFSTLLKDKRFTKTRTHESPRELARQSEAKRKQAPQSEANVCRHKCNLKKTSLINCTRHPIMHRTPNTNKGLRSRTSNAIKRRFEPRNAIGNILRQFENFEIYKDFYENHSSVTGWQELFFPNKSF